MNILNVRSLTDKITKDGMKVKTNAIWRAGNLMTADDEAVAKLKEMNINYIYDFRSEQELKSDGQKLPAHAQTVHIDILPMASMDPEEMKAQMAQLMKDPQNMFKHIYGQAFPQAAGYTRFFQEILTQDTPEFLFHCTGGRDRTGIAGALLMHIFGYNREDIYEEFQKMDMASARKLVDKSNPMIQAMGLSDMDSDEIAETFRPKRHELENFFNAVEKLYGGIDGFIGEFLGITPDEREELKKRYLVKA